MLNLIKSVLTCVFLLKAISGQTTCGKLYCRSGECEKLDNNFYCHCDEGVKGLACDRLLKSNESKCLQNPCWNGGSCFSNATSWMCKCPPGKTGVDCRISLPNEIFYCEENYCENNGVCRLIERRKRCLCPENFSGERCEARACPNCQNGAVCINGSCQCPVDFTGPECEILIQTRTIEIKNKGWYVAKITLKTQNTTVATSSLLAPQKMKLTYKYDSRNPVYIEIHAVAGKIVAKAEPIYVDECWHIWGTTQFPYWSRINCCDL